MFYGLFVIFFCDVSFSLSPDDDDDQQQYYHYYQQQQEPEEYGGVYRSILLF
jgi:hypothetical protein